eukprot:CAMPEP_0114977066 /NCGR_PEP_ID=MMETSP0216-20121206/3027_1 /TAXON_ID=223996 /ORGANISM="Protocruzia adherens, Strain Boccale" /LENGTH=748 /DNA_ID=CAMNT_0002338075 /DNA_START=104 /DNA_END=2350 /DNA_ORIENTATION=+
MMGQTDFCCPQCRFVHSKTNPENLTKNFIILEKLNSEATSENVEVTHVQGVPNDECEIHRKKLQFYCLEDEIEICKACVSKSHKNHRVVDYVSNRVGQSQLVLKTLVDDEIKEKQACLDQFSTITEALNAQYEGELMRIKAYFQAIHDLIAKKEKYFKDILNRKVRKLNQQLELSGDAVLLDCNLLRDLLSKIPEALKEKEVRELKTTLDTLKTKQNNLDEVREARLPSFVPEKFDADEIINQLQGLGYLYDNKRNISIRYDGEAHFSTLNTPKIPRESLFSRTHGLGANSNGPRFQKTDRRRSGGAKTFDPEISDPFDTNLGLAGGNFPMRTTPVRPVEKKFKRMRLDMAHSALGNGLRPTIGGGGGGERLLSHSTSLSSRFLDRFAQGNASPATKLSLAKNEKETDQSFYDDSCTSSELFPLNWATGNPVARGTTVVMDQQNHPSTLSSRPITSTDSPVNNNNDPKSTPENTRNHQNSSNPFSNPNPLFSPQNDSLFTSHCSLNNTNNTIDHEMDTSITPNSALNFPSTLLSPIKTKNESETTRSTLQSSLKCHQSQQQQILITDVSYSNSTIFNAQLMKQFKSLSPPSFTSLKMLYSMSRHGISSHEFHKRCDGHANTVIVVKTGKDAVFGGYSDVAWSSESGQKASKETFLFSLTDGKGRKAVRFELREGFEQQALFHHGKNCGFGADKANKSDLFINFDLLWLSYSNLGHCYQVPDEINGGEYLAGSFSNWKISDIEIYTIQR